MAIALRAAYSSYPSNTQASVVVIAGDLIVVGMSYNAGLQTSTCTDNAAGGTNSYTRVPGTAIGTTAASEVFYAIAKASETVTVTVSAQADVGLSVHVVSGNNQTLASVLDTSNTASVVGAASVYVGPNITTGNADDYLFSYWAQENNSDTYVSDSQSFTIQTNQFSTHYHGTLDRVVAATGTYHDAVTLTLTAETYTTQILAFKAAGGGGATVTYPMLERGTRGLTRGLYEGHRT